MIESFKGGSSEIKDMIDIQFQQTATLDKTSMFYYVDCFVVLLCCFVFYLEKVNWACHEAENGQFFLKKLKQKQIMMQCACVDVWCLYIWVGE